MGIDNDSVKDALNFRDQDVLMNHARIIMRDSDEFYITDTEYDQMAIDLEHVSGDNCEAHQGRAWQHCRVEHTARNPRFIHYRAPCHSVEGALQSPRARVRHLLPLRKKAGWGSDSSWNWRSPYRMGFATHRNPSASPPPLHNQGS